MYWSVLPIWKKETVYVIGGGPSVNDLDLTRLHNRRVLGVNNAYRLGSWVDAVFFGDRGWYGEHQMELRTFAGLKVTICERCVHEPGIKVLRRGKNQGLCKVRDSVFWGNSSGYAGINLAYLLGPPRRIILLGFDMRIIDGKHNYHNDHARKNIPEDIYTRQFMTFMAQLAEELKAEGVEVLNACPGSALDIFPIVDPDEVM